VDIPRKYPEVFCPGPSRFRSDEFVEACDRGLAVDGDFEPPRPRPRNTELIECGAEQSANIIRAVRKVIANTSKPAIVRHNAAAIAIDEATNKFFGSVVDKRLLPKLEADLSQVLLAWAVLRKQARPMFRVKINFRAIVGTSPSPRALAPHKDFDRLASAFDDVRVARVEGDPEPPHTAAS
jgi:hypothetical protein